MRVAVIDIGSNAIRAAVYDSNQLGSAEIFNEKFKSDLSLILEKDELRDDINHSVYKIFSYFVAIFKHLSVSKIECVATEVLRGHRNSKQFIQEIQKRFSIDVKILTGDEEARITTEGLMSSIPDANGVVVDLGGGSLELAEIKDKKILHVVSLPLGTKVISRMKIEDTNEIKDIIKKDFSFESCENLYLIGGSLRLIGRCYMEYTKSVIKNLHNLVISKDEFIKFLKDLQTVGKFQNFYKQFKINKNTILVFKALLEYFDPKYFVISTFGLKEGVRFGVLSNDEKKKDIVLERCYDLSKIFFTNICIKSYLDIFEILELSTEENREKLFKFALILSQYSRHIDRNYKAEWIASFILTTDIPFNQMQRSSLIIAISEAFSTKLNHQAKQVRKILSKEEITYAQIIGSFIKIAVMIDGPYLTKPSFKLRFHNKYLEIDTENKLPKNIFEKSCEVLKKIAFLKKQISN